MKKKITKIWGVGLVVVMLAVLLLSAVPVFAGKPDGCATIKDGTIKDVNDNVIGLGYDQWGYNYQAHMFNGWYDNYSRPDTPVTSGDTYLKMKWSDLWLSNKDCDRNDVLDRGGPGGTSSAVPGAWLTNHQWGSYLWNWDITGDWILEFDYQKILYIHDMVVVDNTFTGTGGYPSGNDPYDITWTVEGTIDGDAIEMRIEYDGSSYYVDAVGTIAQDGTMSGTWGNASQSGVWRSTSGMAVGEICEWNYFVKIVAVPDDAYVDGGYWYTADDVEIGPVIWGSFAIIQQVSNDEGLGEHGILYKSPASPGFGFYKP